MAETKNPFEPTPAGTSPLGTPMEHKETSKPIAGPIPDAQNPDTNANVGENKVNLTSRTAVEFGAATSPQNKPNWPAPLDPSKFGGQETRTPSATANPTSPEVPPAQDNYNPNPVTAGSAEDVKMSAGEYKGDVKTGMFIKVSPLNAADDDFVVGRVTGLDVSGLGRMVYIDESYELKIASFHADDAEILYEVPEEKQGKKVFINDDQTYDARELRMERPRNEKQPVEKQRVLTEQTAKSQFNKNLTTR